MTNPELARQLEIIALEYEKIADGLHRSSGEEAGLES